MEQRGGGPPPHAFSSRQQSSALGDPWSHLLHDDPLMPHRLALQNAATAPPPAPKLAAATADPVASGASAYNRAADDDVAAAVDELRGAMTEIARLTSQVRDPDDARGILTLLLKLKADIVAQLGTSAGCAAADGHGLEEANAPMDDAAYGVSSKRPKLDELQGLEVCMPTGPGMAS